MERPHRKNRVFIFAGKLNVGSHHFKQNAELFALTYGALVVQLIQDYEDYEEVNKQLEKMGYNIGTRLVEDFLARSSIGRCSDFRDVGEVVAKVTYFLELVIRLFQLLITIQRSGLNHS